MQKKSKEMMLPLLIFFFTLLGAAMVALFFWKHNRHPLVYRTYHDYGVQIPETYQYHGIDVSRYQGKIDWKKVRENNSIKYPITFTFIKVTEGVTIKDPYYFQNKTSAKANGLITGSYHYLRCDVSGKDQCSFFLKEAKLEQGDLAPVIDVEDFKGNRNQLLNTLRDFIAELKKYCSVKPIIYTGANFYENVLGNEFDEYPLWVAHYNRPIGPNIGRNWHFWQHTERGTVNGINSLVDMNVFNGDSTNFASLLID